MSVSYCVRFQPLRVRLLPCPIISVSDCNHRVFLTDVSDSICVRVTQPAVSLKFCAQLGLSQRCSIERCPIERCPIERCPIERCPIKRCATEQSTRFRVHLNNAYFVLCPKEPCLIEPCPIEPCLKYCVHLNRVHLQRVQLYCVQMKATHINMAYCSFGVIKRTKPKPEQQKEKRNRN